MPDAKESKEMSPGAKYALIGTVVTAVVGLIGTGLTLYFNYLEKIEPQRLAIQTTQTAEARQTALAELATATSTATPTFTFTPSPSATFTPTATPIFTFTPSRTPTRPISGTKYCVDTIALNVREGAGMDFQPVGALNQDDCLFFDNYVLYDEGGYYWLRISFDQPGFEALGGYWVYGGFLRPQDFNRLPPVTPPARPPTPSG